MTAILVRLRALSKIERSEAIQKVDEKLRARFTAADSLGGSPRILKAAQVVVIDQRDATVVPDASLKYVPTQCGLIRTAMLQHQWALLPAVESDWIGLEAPRCMLTVCFRPVVHGHAGELGREAR